MDTLVTTTIVNLVIVLVHLIPLLLVLYCLHKRAKIYEQQTGKKPWYDGGLLRTVSGDHADSAKRSIGGRSLNS
jgi:hypothetical protein